MESLQLKATGAALDGLEVAYCVFDEADRTVAWNATFLEFFPEHAGQVHPGEPYQENLRRFYRQRLQGAELERIEVYVAEGVQRHRTQRRPYEFDHRGYRIRVSSTELEGGGRVRVWRRVARLEEGQPKLAHVSARAFEDPATPILERLPDGLLVVDQSDRILWANPAFLNLYGLASAADILGLGFEAVYRTAWREAQQSPEFRHGLVALKDHQLFSGAPYELALPQSRWVRILEQRGDAVDGRGYFVHVDITVLKRQQLALQEAEAQLAGNERFIRNITDNVPLRIGYVDKELRYRFVNRAHEQRFGLPRESILGRTSSELTGGATDPVVRPAAAKALAGQMQRYEIEEVLQGQARVFECRLVPDVADDGTVRGLFTTGVDITDRKAGERMLRELVAAEVQAREQLDLQTATLRSVTEAVPAMVAVVDSSHRYRFVNGAFERWRGQDRNAILGRTVEEVMGPAEMARISPWMERALKGEAVTFERSHGPDERRRHLAVNYIPLLLADGSVDGIVAVLQDITVHMDERIRLLKLSERDPLTGLLNRQGLQRFLEEATLAKAGEVALLYIDLDHFKAVNDTHGHPVGDEVLRTVAERMHRLVRPSDALARLGGDEFAIVLSGIREREHALSVAEKVVAAAGEPLLIGSQRIHIGASVGVALEGSDGWRGLLARADAALYRAKAGGRGRAA